ARLRHPARQVSLRGGGAPAVRLVEEATGRLVGTMDEPSAHRFAHDGAVYLHQGETYVVGRLDLDNRVALLECRDPGYITQCSDITEIDMINDLCRISWGDADVVLGDVRVTRRVTGYRMIRSGVKTGEAGLDLPPRVLDSRAIWWTIPNGSSRLPINMDIAGSVHAAEHASTGILPLFVPCDRRDVGGLSTVCHPATGRLGVFVYDEHEGGAGFAEGAFAVAPEWLRATRNAIMSCPCETGCPACVQSPSCGSGNSPLSKAGAVDLLGTLLADAPASSNS
ncbi:MAG: DUF1998 domain-containing protein, partial [Nocardiopsaceae bacterium]|nr:DUF1998 domain-containing protein [Nocardiopsaceae bacterium]